MNPSCICVVSGPHLHILLIKKSGTLTLGICGNILDIDIKVDVKVHETFIHSPTYIYVPGV